MRWRQSFVAEVSETLHQLGMNACPVCNSEESLSIGQSPVLLVDAGLPPGADALPPGEEPGNAMIFTVQVECATCGHLMLFNAGKHRADDQAIVELEPAER